MVVVMVAHFEDRGKIVTLVVVLQLEVYFKQQVRENV